MKRKVTIKFKRLSDQFGNIPLPAYSTEGSSGMDIRAAIEEPFILHHMQTGTIPTNLSVEIPDGYEIQVRPRSGLAANHGIGILNAPGTIDSDYRGEVGIILINHGKSTFTVTPNMRIAQLVFAPVMQACYKEEECLGVTERGEGGFGHTGTH